MSVQSLRSQLLVFGDAMGKNDTASAQKLLQALKMDLLSMDSLPPMNLNDSPTAEEERALAREIYEFAVILAVKLQDKEGFVRNLSNLKPYYSGYSAAVSESASKYSILGLNLLFLLVENKLADFHCELELLTTKQQQHPSIQFCSRLEQHLMIGSYDQVLEAAAHPPVEYYSFLLTSLLATVRLNIAECVAASFQMISISSLTQLLMFSADSVLNTQETQAFIAEKCPDWAINGSTIEFRTHKSTISEDIPSERLIAQNLSYATELERII